MREARMIFVQANLDDELYVSGDDSSTSIVYEEYLECLCRLATASGDWQFQVRPPASARLAAFSLTPNGCA